ncbi:MAG: DinB family protein [Chloroflexota bacterium]
MTDTLLRKELVALLTVRQAHMDFEDAVANFPIEHINTVPQGCTYSFWHLVEHLRFCQKDILDYIISETYEWPNFPDDFWPEPGTTTDAAGWQASINAFLADRQALVAIVQNQDIDLFAPLPNSGEHQHNILREIQIIGAHNAYHTGELGILRQTLGIW